MRVDLLSLSAEEEKCLVSEIAERIKDVVYACSEDLARNLLDDIKTNGTIYNDDVLKIHYDVNFDTLMLIQIVSRFRRLEDD